MSKHEEQRRNFLKGFAGAGILVVTSKVEFRNAVKELNDLKLKPTDTISDLPINFNRLVDVTQRIINSIALID